MFGGDPEAALIQYTSNEEARSAISSIEAVLNNRFIRVYWHREPTGGQQEQGQGNSQGTSLATQHTTTHKVSVSEWDKRIALHSTGCGHWVEDISVREIKWNNKSVKSVAQSSYSLVVFFSFQPNSSTTQGPMC